MPQTMTHRPSPLALACALTLVLCSLAAPNAHAQSPQSSPPRARLRPPRSRRTILAPAETEVRSSKYLNNLIEQDHQNIKSWTTVMLGFKRFRGVATTISGIELMHRIRKGRFNLATLDLKDTLPRPFENRSCRFNRPSCQN
jgi:hypothetical protein